MSETSKIRIDLSAVESNVRVMRRIVGPECLLCPIVKADAYGLGAGPIARHLVAAGAQMLAVYTPGQAAELARSAVRGPILVLQPVRDIERIDEAYRLLVRGDLHLTVHDEGHLDDLQRLAERYATIIPLHLEIDTGMSRGGCFPQEAPEIARRIEAHRWLRLAGVSTHFARSGTDARFTAAQLAAFDAAFRRCRPHMPEDCVVHVANSLAALRHARYHRQMVRFGQAWVGLGFETVPAGPFRAEAKSLRAVVTWRSAIAGIRVVPRGTPVGYGSRWTARRRSVLGLVPVGYADGYPMGAASTDDRPSRSCVGVEIKPGAMRFVPVVGQVNMDQIVIDLTAIAGRAREPALDHGTPVELIGTDPAAPNHLPTLATAAGTIPHELLCRLNPRIKRIYHATERYDAAWAGETTTTKRS